MFIYSYTIIIMGKTNQSSGSFEISVPEGIHKAVIYSVVELGTQTINSAQYGEQQKKQVLLSFEIPSITKVFDKDKGEQAVAISKTYTLSLHEKSRLREVAEAVLGRKMTEAEADEHDTKDFIGGNVMLTIEHNNWYANIKGISKVFDKEKIEPTNPTRYFDINNIDQKVLSSMHDKLKDKIVNTPEYEKSLENKTEDNEDLPF